MFASYHTGSLVLIVALFMCYPGNVYAQAEESVTIQLTVQVCTKGEKNTFKHEIAKKAKVFARNEALVKSGPDGDAWETDNDGKVTLKIPRGTDHPITIYIIFDGSTIPEIAHLSANAKSHELVVAVKSIALYESFYAKNQLAVPCILLPKRLRRT